MSALTQFFSLNLCWKAPVPANHGIPQGAGTKGEAGEVPEMEAQSGRVWEVRACKRPVPLRCIVEGDCPCPWIRSGSYCPWHWLELKYGWFYWPLNCHFCGWPALMFLLYIWLVLWVCSQMERSALRPSRSHLASGLVLLRWGPTVWEVLCSDLWTYFPTSVLPCSLGNIYVVHLRTSVAKTNLFLLQW